MAGELADGYAEPVQEEIPMPEHSAPETPERLQQERNAVEPQADGDSTSVEAEPESKPSAPAHASASTTEAEDFASSQESEQAIGTLAEEAVLDSRSSAAPHDETDAMRDDADSPTLDASAHTDLERSSGPGEE